MGSVFRYLISKIKAISKEIADDLRQLSKSTPCEFFWDILPIEQRPPPGCEIESEHDLVHFHQHFEGLAGLRPEFLYRVLHMDRLSRRNVFCINTRGFWPGPFIGLRIGLSWDYISSHLSIQRIGMSPQISNSSGLLCRLLNSLLWVGRKHGCCRTMRETSLRIPFLLIVSLWIVSLEEPWRLLTINTSAWCWAWPLDRQVGSRRPQPDMLPDVDSEGS